MKVLLLNGSANNNGNTFVNIFVCYLHSIMLICYYFIEMFFAPSNQSGECWHE